MAGSLIIQDDANPYVETESNMSSNLIVIPYADLNAIDTERTRTEDVIFGVSAPFFPNETQEDNIIGKYYLWKFDNYMTDRIELADFSDMNVWDALTQLCQIGIYYLMGFDLNDEGDFFLTNKTNTTYTTSLTISTDPVNNNLISISKDRGLSEIFNYVSVTPSFARMGDIKPELYIAPRQNEAEDKRVVKVGDIAIDTKARHSISSKFICVRGGEIDHIYAAMDLSPFFKWRIYEREIEAMVIGDVASTDTEVTLVSTFRGGNAATDDDSQPTYIKEAVNINDYATFVNPVDQSEVNRKITNIVGNIITISQIGFAIKSRTFIKITSSFDVDNTAKTWSDEGVTTISVSASTSTDIVVDSIKDISKYTVISIQDTVGTSTYARVTTSDPAYSSDYSGYVLDLTGNTITCAEDAIVKAYWSPSKDENADYDYFEIPDTGIWLKIDITNNPVNDSFREGDRLTVISEGMILEQLDQAIQTAYNTTNLESRGRIEFPAINNKFLRRTHAKHFVRNIMNEYSDGHYIITVKTKMIPNLRFVDSNGLVRIKVIDKKLFKSQEVVGYPRNVTHDTKNDITTLIIRDSEAY